MDSHSVTDSCPSTENPKVNYFNLALLIGIVTLAIALGMLLFRSGEKIWIYLERKFTVSIRVSGGMVIAEIDDKPYYFLLKLLSDYFKRYPSHHYKLGYKVQVSQNGQQDETEFSYQPDFGTTVFRYKGRLIRLIRKQTPEVICFQIPYETMTLTTLAYNECILCEIMQDALALSKVERENKTSFYVISPYLTDWSFMGNPKNRRSLDSVILDANNKELLVRDLKEFVGSESWYIERGIPYRRGYLLFGPPGCGKTSLIKALAGEIGYDICTLSLAVKDLGDDALNNLINTIPAKSIVLMEDIESAFQNRELEPNLSAEYALAYQGISWSKVTFRGLLNALDGVASTEGRIVFMTTNYVDRLDPALIRPGRVDLKIYVGYPDAQQTMLMFQRFYKDSSEGLAKEFAEIVSNFEGDVSMATLQGLFLLFKADAGEAVNRTVEYLQQQSVSDKVNTVTAKNSDA